MDKKEIPARVRACDKLLIGLGEEWCVDRGDAAAVERIREAYAKLEQLIQGKDYYIVTMAMDAVIFETGLASRAETVPCADPPIQDETISPVLLEKLDRLFPKKEKVPDTRFQRITAPCGNETWRQCSASCTKDIWEPGEIPDDICPHCGAPLTGNTMDAAEYIEEGYLPAWHHYTEWLGRTFGWELLILELGVGFSRPGVIRFPFEKTAFFNRRAFLCRINGRFPQTGEEISDRSASVAENSVEWIRRMIL